MLLSKVTDKVVVEQGNQKMVSPHGQNIGLFSNRLGESILGAHAL
jgi:hypothetical protein